MTVPEIVQQLVTRFTENRAIYALMAEVDKVIPRWLVE
jgi:hypothetical protein